VSYREITITENTTLDWPWSAQDVESVIARIMEVTPTVPGLVITLPDARLAGPGESTIFRNRGAYSVQINNAEGVPQVTVAPSIAQYVYLTDNATEGGDWATVTFGAGASNVDAASLAGPGLIAISTVLGQDMPVVEIATDRVISSVDRAVLISAVPASGAGLIELPALGTIGDGFFFAFSNLGTGVYQIDPDGSETIDNQTTIDINPGESAIIVEGDSGWYTIGRGRSTIFVQTVLQLNVAGSGDITLTPTQSSSIMQKYVGVLTGNRNVIVPAVAAIYFVSNETSGAFDLTVKTATGAGVVVPQGERVIMNCDGVDVVDSDTVVPTSSFTMASGSESLPGLPFTVDPATGIYRPGANQLAISVAGSAKMKMATTGVDIVNGELSINGLDIMIVMANIS
jgi:hypothetical protein